MSLVLVALLVSSVALLYSYSLAWIATNDTVFTGNMQLKATSFDITMTYYKKGQDDAEYTEITSFASIFEGILPGETVWLKVAYDSKEDEERTADLYLDSFDGCEQYILDDGKYYYFSSQLKIVETDEFLLTPSANLLYYDREQPLPRVRVGEVTIAENSVTEFEFSVQFHNYIDVDQSAYQGFGTTRDEFCYRTITTDFD